MKTFYIEFVRVEHQVFRFEVDAENEEAAREAAEAVVEAPDFEWDDNEVVHSDEWFNEITEAK